MFKTNKSLAFFLIAALTAAAVLWLAPRRARHPVTPGHATMPDTAEEKAKNAQCAKDFCSILVAKEANGPDVNCVLAHRWQEKEIIGWAEPKDVSWSLGPAGAASRPGAKRADILAAVSSPEYTLRLDGKSVACEVGEEEYDVSADITADLTFKNGVVTAISLGGSDYDGPIWIARTLFAAWGVEKRYGSFQGDMLREANRFIKNECPKVLASTVRP